MNVLSLFDGMSCGRVALERADIKVDKYFASEIDKYAIQISKKNWPDIVHLGDVKNLDYYMDFMPKIGLLLGGSPCQGFSFAGKQLAFDDPRSVLFFEYVKIYKRLKAENPDIKFLLENVRMKQEFQDVISDQLGVKPLAINSNLVSAQNRYRLYWTNIKGIKQPEDRGIMLEDILEGGENTVYQKPRGKNNGGEVSEKSPTMTSNSWEHNVFVSRKKSKTLKVGGRNSPAGSRQEWDNVYRLPVIKNHGELIRKPHKSQCLDANYYKGADNHGQCTGCIEVGHAELNGHDFLKRVYSPKGKSPTLTAVCGGNQERKIAIDAKHWRKLSPLECERLQTLPDNYTEGVSNTQRYKMIGNGWTVDVIAHILKGVVQ